LIEHARATTTVWRAPALVLVLALLLLSCRLASPGNSPAAPSATRSTVSNTPPQAVPSATAFATGEPRPTNATPVVTPVAPQPLSVAEAVESARRHAAIGGAELRSHAAGPYESVVQALLGPSTRLIRDVPAGVSSQMMIWGLLFEAESTWKTVIVDLFDGSALHVEEFPRPRDPPPVHRSEIVFEPPIVNVSNGTSLTVVLLINQIEAEPLAPGDLTTIDPVPLDDPPWIVVARTSGGRELLRFTASPEQVWHTEGDYPLMSTGTGGRADLSCGRLDVWTGARPMGPAPGPSFPAGDCDP
jgi:hypothetical protein